MRRQLAQSKPGCFIPGKTNLELDDFGREIEIAFAVADLLRYQQEAETFVYLAKALKRPLPSVIPSISDESVSDAFYFVLDKLHDAAELMKSARPIGEKQS